jgi:hypothetical protein
MSNFVKVQTSKSAPKASHPPVFDQRPGVKQGPHSYRPCLSDLEMNFLSSTMIGIGTGLDPMLFLVFLLLVVT